jgi:hypothetical protein
MRPRDVIFTAALSLAPLAGADAQTPPPQATRSDLTGTVAWFNADKGEFVEYNDWYNSSVYGGGSFGWYWTDHLKSEIDFGASSKAERDVYRLERIDGNQATVESVFGFSTRRIAIAQHYQFFRNVWFHPFVAGGLDLTWETIEERQEAISVFDPIARQTRFIREEVVHPTRTEQHTRPFITFGFKGYVSPRTFFRSDMKFVVRNGVDEVLVRFGMGVDFR